MVALKPCQWLLMCGNMALKLRADGSGGTVYTLGDDGVYRKVETVDYFVKSESSNDVITITLCENRD